eukprot:639146-Amphidinium_carterae.2
MQEFFYKLKVQAALVDKGEGNDSSCLEPRWATMSRSPQHDLPLHFLPHPPGKGTINSSQQRKTYEAIVIHVLVLCNLHIPLTLVGASL